MPRHKKCRFVQSQPGVLYFKPSGIPLRILDECVLTMDEVEAIRLADLEGHSHEQAAAVMGISRATFGRIVASARRSVADALINSKSIRMEHVEYAVITGSAKGKSQLATSNNEEWSEAPMDPKNIKIAAVTDDGEVICAHFGRANFYEVVTVKDGEIVHRERRAKPNHHANHSAKQQHQHSHGADGHGTGSHEKHKTMADAIKDCQMILSRGMGYGAYASMEQFSIKPCVTDVSGIEDAVKAVIDGTIVDHTDKLH
jgi:predicted DNA-binding protein (UPF0251 family)/predicted Fe-Mo cluster-binding NifX family protein